MEKPVDLERVFFGLVCFQKSGRSEWRAIPSRLWRRRARQKQSPESESRLTRHAPISRTRLKAHRGCRHQKPPRPQHHRLPACQPCLRRTRQVPSPLTPGFPIPWAPFLAQHNHTLTTCLPCTLASPTPVVIRDLRFWWGLPPATRSQPSSPLLTPYFPAPRKEICVREKDGPCEVEQEERTGECPC